MKKHLFFLFAISFFVYSCSSNEQELVEHPFDIAQQKVKNETVKDSTLSVSQLAWMEGEWIDSTSFKGNKIVEIWKFHKDTLIGKRGTLLNGNIKFGQTSKIFNRKNSLIYQLEAEGYPSVSFKLNDFSPHHFVFKNKANVAPQEIGYMLNNQTLNQQLKIVTPAGERIIKSTFIAFQR